MIIDLRSDTVTRPTPAMLQAMFGAKVGDDVLGDDPTVKQLEEKTAHMFGMESALFCSSGTQTNQIAIKVHTQPGDEVICHKYSHVYYYEGGGIAMNSSASTCLLEGEGGLITADDVAHHVNAPDDPHRPLSRLVSVENTMNKGGGTIYDFNELKNIAKVCKEYKLGYHLDGARLFNALVETKETPKDYGKLFDSISICLSKGLGAPVGSLLLGNKDFIAKARRVRKVLGGGMRQAGYLAAAGIYALDNNIERLKEDHKRAKQLAEILKPLHYVKEVTSPQSNLVFFKLTDNMPLDKFVKTLEKHDVFSFGMGYQQMRFVTHLDFTDDHLIELEKVLKKIA